MKPLQLVPLLFTLLLPSFTAAAVHDVLAHATADRAWVARVKTITNADGPMDQTTLLIRKSGPGQQWNPLVTIPARASALASRSSQLVVLLSNGQWMAVWGADGASTGAALPADGHIRAITNDTDSLWAVGTVRGGMAAVARGTATQPAGLATSRPSTDRVTSSIDAAVLPKLVLFKQQSGGWVALADFPADAFVPPTGDISVAIVAGRPWVSFELTDRSIRTLRLNSDNTWEDVGLISARSGETVGDFELVSAGSSAVLWTTNGKGPGRIYPGASATRPPVDLAWSGGHSPDSIAAVMFSGGYLRVIGLSADKLYEQRYELDGKIVDVASELSVPAEVGKSVQIWIDTVLCFALAFSVGATIYRRSVVRAAGATTELQVPVPAPFLPRLGAGVIDMIPVLAVLAYVALHSDASRDPWERLQEVSALIASGIGIAVYLLHTTLSELFSGRTIGKWIFGLKVVTISGTKPSAGQMVLRNLLRIIDLLWFPLILVVISPLRQRSADLSAGTMVIRADDPAKKQNNPDENTGL